MKYIDPLVTGYERGTFEDRSAQTESLPRQNGKNSEDDSCANNNICETLGILSVRLRDLWSRGAGCLFRLQRRIERRDKRDVVGNGKVLAFRDGQSKVALPSVAQVRAH